jgi:hypothetical protein
MYLFPPIELQRGFDEFQVKVDTLKRLHAETSAELEAMLPSMLDQAFRNEI